MSLQLLYPQATEMVDDYIIYLSPLGGNLSVRELLLLFFILRSVMSLMPFIGTQTDLTYNHFC